MTPSLRRLAVLLLVGFGLVLSSLAARADPPYRVARLSYESGSISFSPAGESDWSRAAINRPLITGDRVWADAGSRAELQLDGAALRVGDQTGLVLLNVDDRIAQIQLTQGELEIRVWRLDANQSVEIDTPNLAYVIRRPGSYRVDVSPQYGSTAATVRAGEATLYGEGNAFRLLAGDTWEFYDTALRDYDTYRSAPPDDLARFALARDRRWEASASARHVSRELIGFEELDQYGEWREVPDYGWVWAPTRVSRDWAPYREGHWAWVEPWGWTWVDDQPWGFAPSHYGRWAFVQDRWCWVPGPANVRPVYAPALVAFVGGGAGVVGWFPLGPREVYRPAYPVSRNYFTRVNVSNTVVSVTQVTTVYETRNTTNVVYRNQRVPGAVVAVPTATFAQARPVAREMVHVRAENAQPQPVMSAPPVAPARQSVHGAQPAQHRPPEHAFTRQVVAQTPPPPPPAPIESRLQALQAHPGQPAAPASTPPARAGTPGASAAPAPAVKVVPATPAASAPPPPAAAAAASRPERERRREERRAEQAPTPASASPPARPVAPAASTAPPARTAPAASTAPPASAAPAAAVPARPPSAAAPVPAPATPPPSAAVERRREEERVRANERERGERPAVGASRPNAPPAPAPAAAAPAPVAPVAPAARPPQTPPPAPPVTAPRPQPSAPQPKPAVPPPAAARAPEPVQPPPRAREEQREQRREQQQQEPKREAPPPKPVPPPPSAPAAAPAPAPAPAPHPVPPPKAAPPAPPAAAEAARAHPSNPRAEERREAASQARKEREQQR